MNEHASTESIREILTSTRNRIAMLSERIERAVKLNTMRELRASAIADREAKREDLETVSKRKKEIAILKRDTLNSVSEQASAAITAFLPRGKAVVEVGDEGRLAIGWNLGDGTVKWEGLSGGERAAFLVALACAASKGRPAVVSAEIAEMDYINLDAMMSNFEANLPDRMQVILNTHLVPVGGWSNWNIIDMLGGRRGNHGHEEGQEKSDHRERRQEKDQE